MQFSPWYVLASSCSCSCRPRHVYSGYLVYCDTDSEGMQHCSCSSCFHVTSELPEEERIDEDDDGQTLYLTAEHTTHTHTQLGLSLGPDASHWLMVICCCSHDMMHCCFVSRACITSVTATQPIYRVQLVAMTIARVHSFIQYHLIIVITSLAMALLNQSTLSHMGGGEGRGTLPTQTPPLLAPSALDLGPQTKIKGKLTKN